MNYGNLCINCMHEKPEGEPICPFCGFDDRQYSYPVSCLPPFTILDGKYILGRMLGSGGFGITYIGFDTALEKVVAIKEFFIQMSMYRNTTHALSMTVSATTDEQQSIYEANREKFAIEARTLAQLEKIPGIVRVYNLFEENDTLYIVMEYLSGMTLKDYCKQYGKMSFEETLRLMTPMMGSLESLHKLKIFHRDISPDNIMVREDKTLTLYDFGGAKVRDNQGASNVIMAKAGYSPIEQLQSGGQVGPWTDVYSLAATMYFCITGEVPIESAGRIGSKDSLQSPRLLGADITPAQEKALLKGMAIRYTDRYQSMGEMEEALGQYRSGSNKARIAAAVIGAVLIGVGAFGVYRYIQNFPEPGPGPGPETESLSEAKESGSSSETGSSAESSAGGNAAIEGGPYIIATYDDQESVLAIPDDYYSTGLEVVLEKNDGHNYQFFYIKPQNESTDNAHYISAVCSDHSLTAQVNAEGDAAELVQDEFSEELKEEQNWYFENAGRGAYYIRSQTGGYIVCSQDSGSEESEVEMADGTDSAAAKWILIPAHKNENDMITPLWGTSVPLDSGVYQFTPRVNRNLRLEFTGDKWKTSDASDSIRQKYHIDSDADGMRIRTEAGNTGLIEEDPDEIWHAVFAGRGCYYIRDGAGNVVTLDSKTNKVFLDSLTDTENNIDVNKMWYIEETGLSHKDQMLIDLLEMDTFVIRTPDSDNCVFSRNDSLQEGSILQFTQDDSGATTEFSLEEVTGDEYRIINNASDKAITVLPDVDSKVHLMNRSEDYDQTWVIEADNEGFYLKTKTGYYLEAASDEDGNVSITYDVDKNAQESSLWKLERKAE